ncbi:GNAT family N-acetyltransferase [Streptomyces sp. SID12501]|uniref:GNAT family N-acetyltransferase n=1 Tax=Streptomyces sp. SID12501 TaxID=2706042 RepID=A0A6B3BV95_9ACTN|nr:GNAT family N-acetyltransferase [Streptomyces sp. SID12501]
MPSGMPNSGQDQFRSPREKDLADLYRLDHEAFGETDGYTHLVLRQLFDAHRRDFLLLKRDGVLCGYALPVLGAREDHACLLALAVLPEFQGQGCGRSLLNAAVQQVREAGARRMELAVREENHAARGLYKKYGFRDGELLTDYYGPGNHRFSMSYTMD